MIKPQREFPLLEEYSKVFNITEGTIFAFDDIMYTDYTLTPDLLVHENIHLERQREIGADIWVAKYLTDKEFRLQEELLAYKAQLNSIKDRNLRHAVRMDSAKNLSSSLYGNIITTKEAFNKLK